MNGTIVDKCVKTAFLFFSLLFSNALLADQTLVFMRHGEKPKNNSGVLNCKGQNRAFALPKVLAQFGEPQALFAAAPKQNQLGNSIRSAQTLLPTATVYSMPIHLNYHADEVNNMKNALRRNEYKNSTIFIAWQHENLVKIARAVYKNQGGDPKEIPDWKKDDFDSLYIFKFSDKKKPIFIHAAQNLDHVSDQCP